MNNIQKKEIFRPVEGHTFRFRCHKDIQCFTKCCADLNLILTPYDLIRIKNRLGIPSESFLDTYTDTTLDSLQRFPMVKLKMNHDEEKKCPFVTPDGCTIYEDRPGACRIYPIGRAALKVDGEKEAREKYFIVNEKHCLGFQEERQWTIEEWMANEGVDEYKALNDQWLEIITSKKDLGPEKDVSRKIRMFFMASYNIDKFREFVFKSKFFNLFEVEPALKKKLAFDDIELMKFGFDWLKFSLFGEKTIKISIQQ